MGKDISFKRGTWALNSEIFWTLHPRKVNMTECAQSLGYNGMWMAFIIWISLLFFTFENFKTNNKAQMNDIGIAKCKQNVIVRYTMENEHFQKPLMVTNME